MNKKYIEDIIIETDEELLLLQNQMAELLEDLKYSQEKQQRLQKDRNKDTNIFSPRSKSLEMDEKLEKAKEEVKTNNQRIEYIRERIEISTKKKLEYQTLLSEQDNEKNEEKHKEHERILEFLQGLYKDVELCLALLNGDKNKCRTELKKIKMNIKKYAEEIEKN